MMGKIVLYIPTNNIFTQEFRSKEVIKLGKVTKCLSYEKKQWDKICVNVEMKRNLQVPPGER